MFNDTFLDKSYSLLSLDYPIYAQGIYLHRTHENKPLTFRSYKYLKAIYKDQSHHQVHKKGTQASISEYLIVFAFNKAMNKKNVFYILPKDDIKARFVQSRVNTSIEYTPYYKVKMKNIDSASMKSFGGIINFVGSNSKANFGEFVATIVIIDEKDYCNQNNIVMAKERQARQEMEDRYTIEASNPTISDFGIDLSFKESDQKYWFNKCDCGHKFAIDFFKHIVRKEGDNDFVILDKGFDFNEERDCNIICDKCGKAIDRFGEGEWVKKKNSFVSSGYQYSQFFTSPTPIRNQLLHFNRGLTSDIEMQRFYNAVMGETYMNEGAKITLEMLKNITEKYKMEQTSNNPCVCGVDVGNNLTTVIGEVIRNETNMKIKIIWAGDLKTDKDLIELNRRYNIISGVIDAKPEIRLSRQIAATFKGWWMCNYLTDNPKDMIDITRKIIKTDRTTSLDEVKSSIVLGDFILPEVLVGGNNFDNDFVNQVIASVRVWEENEHHIEGGRYVWKEGSKADHFFHALNYMNLAYKLIKMRG